MAEETLAWPNFQILQELPEVSEKSSVAEDVLATFGIPYNGSGGGSLNNVDIKRADALSSLKTSLLEEFAKEDASGLVELRINADGEAEFYEVGDNAADMDPYYTINSNNYVRPNVGVSVTGAKPKQERIVYDDWYQIVGPEANSTIFDTTKLNSNCLLSNFTTHATITYNDPFRNSPNSSWNNGMPDIFELETPFDRFIGFSWRITPPSDLVTPFTKIYQQSQSSIPVLLTDPAAKIGTETHPDIGTLIKRKVITIADPALADCATFDDSVMNCSSSSIPLNLEMVEGLTYESVRGTTISKFLGVQGVFVVGIPLISCWGVPVDDAAAVGENSIENTVLCVFSKNLYRNIIKLHESIHYAVLYNKEDDTYLNLPCFQFVNNLRYNDYAQVGTAVNFYIDHLSEELVDLFQAADPAVGTILPLENNNGILVEQVWAQIALDTPCFIVSDPTGRATEIAQRLKVELLGMVIRDLPSPMAINGELIDQLDGIVDNDPTTVQDLQETAMERALTQMSSGRTLSLTLASLDEDETATLSRKLYELLLQDTGEVYTHTCPPTDEPKVGDRGVKGGIVNIIEYSYTDQGSYLINVTEGPEYFGDFSGIDGGIYYKQTEEVSTKGTIIQDLGNHVQYLVHVDGIGPIMCINGCANVLAVRDRVSITIHNNAVEG